MPAARTAGLAPRRAAAWGFGAGLLAYGAVLHWLYVIVRVHASGPAWLGFLAIATVAIYSALFTAVFGALAGGLARRAAAPLLLAALWAATDHLRSQDRRRSRRRSSSWWRNAWL